MTPLRPLSNLNHQLSCKRGRMLCRSIRSVFVHTMAVSTIVYVKGDPVTKTLGDCPFCHRALLTFEAKHVPYTLDYIDFANKPDWLQEVSGGKVPIIKEEGQPHMPDSDRIVVHMEEKYPEPSMKSSVPPELGAKLFPAFRGFLMGPAAEQEKKALLESELRAINDYLTAHKNQGPLFGGRKLNATDAAIAPKLYHCQVALKHFKGWELPEELTAIKTYLQEVKKVPEWKKTDYGEAMIIKGWERHMSHA